MLAVGGKNQSEEGIAARTLLRWDTRLQQVHGLEAKASSVTGCRLQEWCGILGSVERDRFYSRNGQHVQQSILQELSSREAVFLN